MSPTPQTDPTEGNRSARSEPAVERDARPGMPVKSCQLARCLFVTQKKRPHAFHALDLATETASCCSARDRGFQRAGWMI